MRERCHRCRKASIVCICPGLPRIPNRTEIVILQHPREREHPFGTARFAELGLERVQTFVHYGLGRAPSPLGALPDDTALIYPAAHAPELRSVPRPSALLFLDGTWAQSRTLYRINPALAALPHLRIDPRTKSRYLIRSEPAPWCVSTIEAIAEALAIVEPDLEGLDRLVAAFESMIARQLEFRSRPALRRKKARPKPESRALPNSLREGRRLILAHGELSRGELVYLVASDLAQRRFECALKPRIPPADWWLARAGLEWTSIERGLDPRDLPARWRAFAGPEDVLVCWTRSLLESIAAATSHSAPSAVLKTAYCNLRSARSGSLEEVLQREGLDPLDTGAMGRAGRSLSMLIPLAGRMFGR